MTSSKWNIDTMNDPHSKSEVRAYPNFAKKLILFTFTCTSLAVLSIAFSFYLEGMGNPTLANVFIGLFALLISIGLIGTLIRLYTVRCYVCGGPTKTIKSKKKDLWQAYCPSCHITWNLGIGINTD